MIVLPPVGEMVLWFQDTKMLHCWRRGYLRANGKVKLMECDAPLPISKFSHWCALPPDPREKNECEVRPLLGQEYLLPHVFPQSTGVVSKTM